MISVQVRNLDKATQRLEAVKNRLISSVDRAVEKEATNMVSYIVEQKLNGQVLHVQSGTLRRSITYRMEGKGTGNVKAFVGTIVKYGKAWEFGFSRKVGAGAKGGPRTLKGKSLQTYLAKHPPKTKSYAARPFMRPSLAENQDRIVGNIRKAISEAMK